MNLKFWGFAAGLGVTMGSALAGNILVNPGFEANSGHVVASGWSYFSPPSPSAYFGDYWVENAVPAHSGSYYWKEWGALYLSAPTNNAAGIFQTFSSALGDTYLASAWFYTATADTLGADCVTWIQVEFLNASNNLLAVYKSDNFSASVGTDAWLQYQVNIALDLASPISTGDPNLTTYAPTGSVSQLEAPPGTTTVRYRYVYLQVGNQGGSAYLDDAVLDQVNGAGGGIAAPSGLMVQAGDKSLVLHWDASADANVAGYKIYRSTENTGPSVAQSSNLLTSLGFCDLNVTNGQTYYYQVSALTQTGEESFPSARVSATPNAFASDDAFLEYVQQASFDYFWYAANPANGLVPDRTAAGSACSIAAVGFGLTAIGIGIDHGWISRTQGVARVLTTLRTFLQKPQSADTNGSIGYKGWFYHFLDMNTALRAPNSELSSIDSVLLLSGMLYAKQYFNGADGDESEIRASVDAIFDRMDWNWMAQGSSAVSMGWFPPGSFIQYNWSGYNEGMILYLLGLGKATNPLPPSAWFYWTNGYAWSTNYGQAYVPFPPLFGHEFSHCWVDFRHLTDAYMNSRNCTYFENSRRAIRAQIAYCIANPSHWPGYGANVWGLSACDDPITHYQAHGAPPAQDDDGTIAPAAVGGALALAPEYSLPTLKYFYSHFREDIWTAYGFREAFSQRFAWYDPDEVGIDAGSTLIMIENYRTQGIWKLFMRNAEVQRGLARAGFVKLPFIGLRVQSLPSPNTINLAWTARTGRAYQVEYSTDLKAWFTCPGGEVIATGSSADWTDSAPPSAGGAPYPGSPKFYRLFQLGTLQ